jgi:aspartate dehydrogenase
MKRIGIVGCGAIGTTLALTIERDYPKLARVVALVDHDTARAQTLSRRLHPHPLVTTLPTCVRRSDVLVEAASVAAAADVARRGLAAGRDVLIMSTGGLLLDAQWRPAAARSRGRLVLPSGALCGLDGLKAMAVGRLRRLRLTTRKPPASLAAAPAMARRRAALARLRRPLTVFRGSPREAVHGFPQNTNVAATLALAVELGASAENRRRPVPITIRVVADPTVTRNVHELEVDSDAGRMVCRMESRPSSDNPKTSQVAAQAAVAALRQLLEPVRIGT